jgi:hypothetical protein
MSRDPSSFPHLFHDRLEVAGGTASEERERDVQVACPDGPNTLRSRELALLPCAERPDGIVGEAKSDEEA